MSLLFILLLPISLTHKMGLQRDSEAMRTEHSFRVTNIHITKNFHHMNYYNEAYILYLGQFLSVHSFIQNILNKIHSLESFQPKMEHMTRKYLLSNRYLIKPFVRARTACVRVQACGYYSYPKAFIRNYKTVQTEELLVYLYHDKWYDL
jgi:hypothetical protein